MPNAKYLTKRHVPILDEHELKDDDGNTLVKVDEARLKKIAEKNNQRIAQTGDLTPFVIGHTKDDASEDDQPQIVAYAANFTVRPFGKTGRKALCVDMKYQAHNRDLINKYPRRSVELWLDDWKIDPIALLGATTPERDLGLLQLARGGRRKLRRVLGPKRYQMPLPPSGQTQPPPSPGQGGGSPQVAEIAQAVVAMLQDTEEWQFLGQMIQEQQAPPPPMPGMDDLGGMMPPPMPEQELPPEVVDDFDDEEYEDGGEDEDDDDDEEEDDDEEPARYSASFASGTNTHQPTGPRRMSRPTQQTYQPVHRYQRPQAGTADLAHRLRMAADARRIQYARQERAMQYMAQGMQRMQLKLQRAEREKDLIQLEAEGVLFDRIEELDAVMGMPEDYYQSHLGRLRKRYQRAPLGRMSFSAEDIRADSPRGSRDKDSAMSVADYALANGLSYEAAAQQMGR